MFELSLRLGSTELSVKDVSYRRTSPLGKFVVVDTNFDIALNLLCELRKDKVHFA
jgi:hypothetical protein